jgi:hypothetical protein
MQLFDIIDETDIDDVDEQTGERFEQFTSRSQVLAMAITGCGRIS